MATRHFYKPQTGIFRPSIMERLSTGLMGRKIPFRYEDNDTILYQRNGRLVTAQWQGTRTSIMIHCETPQACVAERKKVEGIIRYPLELYHSEKVGRLS